MDILHVLQNTHNLPKSLNRGIVRGDVSTVKQIIARMWRNKQHKGYLKWRLPFLVCSYSYHNIREFDSLIFSPKDVTGPLVLSVLETITKAPKSTEALALADIYMIVTQSNFHSDEMEVNRFFDYLRAPKLRSTQDAFLNWYGTCMEKPISSSDSLLLNATAYLLAIRKLSPNLESSGYQDTSLLRFLDLYMQDDFYDFTNNINSKAYVKKEEIDKIVSDNRLPNLYFFLYSRYPSDFYGPSSMTDLVANYRISVGGVAINKIRQYWEECKQRFDGRDTGGDEGGDSSPSPGVDGESYRGRKLDILREKQSEDAQEELWPDDGGCEDEETTHWN